MTSEADSGSSGVDKTVVERSGEQEHIVEGIICHVCICVFCAWVCVCVYVCVCACVYVSVS